MIASTESAWIQTSTNRRFYLLAPRPEDIVIEDIAHSLSMQCRFCGHTKFHYSVAQHSIYCSLIVLPRFAREALLHDAAEAYIADWSRPLKHATRAGEEYLKIEDSIHRAIARRFGLPPVISPEVKAADNRMMLAEKRQLMPPMDWSNDAIRETYENCSEAHVLIERFTPEEVEDTFLERFGELY